MTKIILIFIMVTTVTMSFQIGSKKDIKTVNGIPYPFDVCGKGKWTMESLTLS